MMYVLLFLLSVCRALGKSIFAVNDRLRARIPTTMSRARMPTTMSKDKPVGRLPTTIVRSSKDARFDSKFKDVYVHAESSYQQTVSTTADKGVSLTNYMRLPVEQYMCIDIPLGGKPKLQRVGEVDGGFRLTVPPLKIFDLEVFPIVEATVSQTDSSVVIESYKVTLGGSQFVQSLNGIFEMKVKAELTYKDTPYDKVIFGNSDIKMWVNSPPPFNLMPKEIQETTGNVAMQLSLDQLQMAFLKSLGQDYERWVTSDAYRQQR